MRDFPRVFPSEWSDQARLWTAWPSHPAYWEGQIDLARDEIAEFFRRFLACEEIPLSVWVDPSAKDSLPEDLRNSRIDWLFEPLGDIWFRDTGPLFVRREKGLEAIVFTQNGWGGKFIMPGDERVGEKIASEASIPRKKFPLVTEGGALEMDGEGTLITTESCVLNPNRNPGLTRAEAEEIFRTSLGIRKTIWLEDGLRYDHTDGHIDNVARFVGPGHVAVMKPWGEDDPQTDVLHQIQRQLAGTKDALGRTLQLFEVPSPGLIRGPGGEILPASHLNFLISNRGVYVPTFASSSSGEALERIGKCFPGRQVIGLSARSILSGGGTFHCMTQQQPKSATSEENKL